MLAVQMTLSADLYTIYYPVIDSFRKTLLKIIDIFIESA